MKTKFAWLLVVGWALMMPGCAPQMVWQKPGSDSTQLAQDRYRCMRETGFSGEDAQADMAMAFGGGAAAGAGGFNPYLYPAMARANSRRFFAACMEAGGYRLEESAVPEGK